MILNEVYSSEENISLTVNSEKYGFHVYSGKILFLKHVKQKILEEPRLYRYDCLNSYTGCLNKTNLTGYLKHWNSMWLIKHITSHASDSCHLNSENILHPLYWPITVSYNRPWWKWSRQPENDWRICPPSSKSISSKSFRLNQITFVFWFFAHAWKVSLLMIFISTAFFLPKDEDELRENAKVVGYWADICQFLDSWVRDWPFNFIEGGGGLVYN